MTTPTVEGLVDSADGTRIAWQQFGEGGPVVLVANGIGCTWKAMLPQIRGLSERFRVLTWDYRGIAGSGPPGSGGQAIASHARDALAVLGHHGATLAGIVGWSMGVNVAFELALQQPGLVPRIAGLGGVPYSPFRAVSTRGVHRVLRRVTHSAGAIAPAATPIVSRLLRSPAFFDAAVAVRFLRPEADREAFLGMAAGVAEQHHGDYLRTLAELGRHDRRADLHEVDLPVLLLVGSRDLMIRPAVVRAVASALPRGQARVVEGTSHFLTVEAPEVVNSALLDFLERG